MVQVASGNPLGGSIETGEIADLAVTNAKVATAAAIAYSKLAALTSANLLIGNGSNVATVTAVTGDVTISNAGVTTIGAGKVTEAMQVLADNTTGNVSTSAHGYVVKAPNSTTQFFRGDATWATVSALNPFSGLTEDVTMKGVYIDFYRDAIDTTKWTSAVTGSGTNTATTTDFGGFIRTTVTTTSGDDAKMTGDILVQTGSFTSIIVEFEVRFVTALPTTTAERDMIGLLVDGTNVNAITFGQNQFSASDVNWSFATADSGSTVERDDNLTAPTLNAWTRIRFEVGSTGTTAKCFINGSQVGTTHSTNLPATTTGLRMLWFLQNVGGAGTARSMDVRRARMVLIP